MYQNQMNEIFVVVFRFLYLELRRLNIRSVLSTNIGFWVIFLDFSFEENELLCGNKISFRTVFCPSINNSVQFLSHKFVHVWKTSSSLCTYRPQIELIKIHEQHNCPELCSCKAKESVLIGNIWE